jgi:hypothetical protein
MPKFLRYNVLKYVIFAGKVQIIQTLRRDCTEQLAANALASS